MFFQLVGIERCEFKDEAAHLMHEVHAVLVNEDALCAHGCYGCCRRVHSGEMHSHSAVVLEAPRHAQGSTYRSAEAVDKHVDILALVLRELVVHIVGIEIVSADISFQFYQIILSHHYRFQQSKR